ncbi:pentapeptide repeat-containing protein [Sinomonas atrocyanea]|uniref:pentapeptide repeat-containing protein n=1 Tax=Sinomonas atrocyanea TaxID=37927 RepID=UPI003D9549D8
MARQSRPAASSRDQSAPRLDPLRLDGLDTGFAGDIEPGGRTEGLAFEGTDLAGLALEGTTFAECSFRDVAAHDADLRSASFLDCRLERLGAPRLAAPRSRWRGVEVEASRIGSAELYDGELRGVVLRGCKLGYVNLRGASLQDVLFADCAIDELDLGGARATRVAFEDTTVESLDVTHASLTDVDVRGARLHRVAGVDGLRGAILSSMQAVELAELMAAQLGIDVRD